MELAYSQANWELFGELFAVEYTKGDDSAKLKLLRSLLTKYRDEGAMRVCLKIL